VSPSITVYSIGPERVGVMVTVGVFVAVEVIVAVAVGVIGVDVAVLVAVGVCEAKRDIFCLLGPMIHTINIITPTRINNAAKPQITNGKTLCLLL